MGDGFYRSKDPTNSIKVPVLKKKAVDRRTIMSDRANYSVSQKIPPAVFWKFFPNGWEFLINFLRTYYAIISTMHYKLLFKYLQL